MHTETTRYRATDRCRDRTWPIRIRNLGLAAIALLAWACGDGTTDPDSLDRNDPPVAAGAIPAQAVQVGQTVTLNLSQYFNDPDGDALTFAAQTANANVATVSVSGSSATVAGVSRGNTTITVTASDPDGLTAQQSFVVDVPNRTPEVVGNIADLDLLAGDTVEIDVSGYFNDPDGDALTFAAQTANANVATVSVSGSSATVAGVSRGNTTITVTASDPDGLTAQQSFVVDVPNRTPEVVGNIADLDLLAGDTVEIDVSGYFNDPDGDALTFAAQTANANVATVSVSGSSATVAGVSRGNTTITVTASDPDGLTAQQSFVVDVPNRTPEVVGNIADLDLLAGDTVEIDVSGYFDDPDGDALTYDVATSDEGVATAATEGTAVTVIAVSDGNASLTVTASDPGGLSAQQSFSATVDPPGDPRVQFLTDPVAVLEGGMILVQVEARPPPESPLEVGYSFGGDDDPRTNDADEADHDGGSGGTVRFEAGSRRVTLEIAVRDDADAEPTREVLAISLDTPEEGAGYQLGSSVAAVATIEEGVCDRTPRVRDELMVITEVYQCHEMDGSHLASIDTIDLRGPVLDVAPDLRGSEGAGNRSCGLEAKSVSRGRGSRLPVAELTGCLPAARARMAPAPPPSSANTGAGDAITKLRAGDFLELTELKELWLFNNDLTELPAGIFSELTELRVLILDHNRLKELPEGLLSGLSRLEIFAAADNELTRLPPDLFSGLSRLKGVWLYRNELAELPAGAFSDLDDLERLYLWENSLDALPAGIFAELGRLKVLSLGTNRLTELDAEVFSELGDLEQLYLFDNRLTELPPGVFANLGSLEMMYLYDNRLTELPPGVFANLGSLEAMYLNKNRLQGLPKGLFEGVPSLVTLGLSGNQIAEIESGAFSGLPGLQALWLGDNRILDLEAGMFDGLSRLQQLGLGENPVTELRRDVFADLSRLDELSLNQCELTLLQPGAFNGLSGLTILVISENQLTTLESGTFTGLPALLELWLYSNQIKDLSDDVLAELPLLRKLILWGNQLTELPPAVFSELTRLEELYISRNKLAELSAGVFTGLSELAQLNLDFNPGTPFILDVQLERADTSDLAAPGPAKVVLSLAEGAPFPMTIPLAVEGGTLSTTTAVIERGQSTSAEFTVTMSSSSGTEVVVGPAPLVPDRMVGIHLVAADTLVLFTTSGDASDAGPDMAARLEEPGSGTGDLAPVMLAAGLLGSTGLRLRPRSKDRGARSRTGCSAGGVRCKSAAHGRSAGGRAWSRRASGRAP